MQRTTLTVDGHSYELAQGTNLGALKDATEKAVIAGGRFIDVTVVGNIAVSLLVSPGVAVFLATREVADDSRDNGELTRPFEEAQQLDWDIADLY